MQQNFTFLLLISLKWIISASNNQGISTKIDSCRCYQFESKKGYFKSPNYPRTYPKPIECLVYHFKAPIGSIIQLYFWTLSMKPPDPDHGCRDYLEVWNKNSTYQNETNETDIFLSEYGSKSLRICGSIIDLPMKNIYSTDNEITLIFHSERSNTNPVKQAINYQGFYGSFKRINKSDFQVQTQRNPQTYCSFNLTKIDESPQIIQSPLYPRPYPDLIKCVYNIHGPPNEVIMITFESIHLRSNQLKNESSPRTCFEDPDSIGKVFDFIVIREASSSDSKQQLARICHSSDSIQIVSHGSFVQVVFVSISEKELNSRQGFRAKVTFVEANLVQSTQYIDDYDRTLIEYDAKRLSDKRLRYSINNKKTISDKEQREEEVPNMLMIDKEPIGIHEKIISSANSREGQIKSKNFPQTYPKNFEIIYLFKGKVYQAINITISVLELGETSYERDCDSFEIYNGQTTSHRKLFHACGSEKSLINHEKARFQEIYFITSESTAMIRFKSNGQQSEYELGYNIHYRFINKKSYFGQSVKTPFSRDTMNKYSSIMIAFWLSFMTLSDFQVVL